MPSFPVDGLIEASARTLQAAGTPEDIAQKLARWLVNANLSGHPSHGIQRVPEYVKIVKQGRWEPAARPKLLRETETTVLFDGQMGFGHLTAEALTRAVAAKARERRVAIGGAIRCTHIGRLGEWSELAAELGVLFLMCSASAEGEQAAPFGGVEGRLGTNPFTFGAPAAEDDLMLIDFATTAAAEGKIRVYRDRGEQIPSGWIIDKQGNPSTDPNDLYDDGLMLPFGGHKGYALAVMVSILGGNLVGSALPELGREAGVFALAIDPAAFGDGDAVKDGIRANLDRLRGTRPAPGFAKVLAPGDPERAAREAGRDQPIELPEATWRDFLAAAEELGLAASELEGIVAGG